MMLYEIVKTVHILSAALLFGTGLGTAWFMWRADRTGDPETIAATAGNVVLADWLFTLLAVVLQPVSGFWLIDLVGYLPAEIWLMWSYGLYLCPDLVRAGVAGVQRGRPDRLPHGRAALSHGPR